MRRQKRLLDEGMEVNQETGKWEYVEDDTPAPGQSVEYLLKWLKDQGIGFPEIKHEPKELDVPLATYDKNGAIAITLRNSYINKPVNSYVYVRNAEQGKNSTLYIWSNDKKHFIMLTYMKNYNGYRANGRIWAYRKDTVKGEPTKLAANSWSKLLSDISFSNAKPIYGIIRKNFSIALKELERL